MKLSKRLLSLFLCSVMVLGAVPFSGVTSFAEESCTHIDANSDNICDECKAVLYIYSSLDGDTVINTVKDIPSTAVKITAETTALENGWNYVEGKVDISHTVSVQGTANLILCDGAELTVNGSPYYAGIYVTPGNTLNIYGQARGNGILRVTAGDFSAAIGGSGGDDEGTLDVTYDAGDINIYSGCIYPAGDFGAAAIGGAFGGDCGDITVAGGIIQPSTVGGGSGGLSVSFGEGYKDGAKAGSGTLSIVGGVIRATCDGGVARCKSVNVTEGIDVYDLKTNVYDYNLRVNNPSNPIKDALIGTLEYLKDGQSEFFDFSKFAIYEGQTTLDDGSFYYVIDSFKLPSTLYASHNVIVIADHVTLDSRAGKEFNSSKVYRQSEGSACGLFMTDYAYSESGQKTAIGNYKKYNGELSLTDGRYYISEDYDINDSIELNGDVRFIISDGVTFSAYFFRNGAGEYTVYTESTGDNKGVFTEKKKTYYTYVPDETTGKYETRDLPKNYKLLGDGTTWGTDGETTWYFADSSKTFSSRIFTQGDVHLVLKDGIALNCTWGITVAKGSSLTIYAQSLDKKVMGSLTADGRHFHDSNSDLGDVDYPGIGNDRDNYSGNITINGGNITAYGGINCPAIGPCYAGNSANRPILTFNGGYIKAEPGDYAAGIGTGSAPGWSNIYCSIIISGGNITANGTHEAPAIGIGKSLKSFCDLYVGGGFVVAKSFGSIPAIGKSEYSYSSSFTMTNSCFVDVFDDSVKDSTFNTYGEAIKINSVHSGTNIRIVENGKTVHRLKKAYNPADPVFDTEAGELISHGSLPYYQCDCGLYYSDPELTQLIGSADELEAWKASDGICDETRVVKYLDYVDGEFIEAQIPESTVNYLNNDSYTIGKSNQTTWYYAVADVYIDLPITVKGDVRLILKDGITATSELGIQIDGSDSLTVYSQSQGENAGTLIGRERVAITYGDKYKGTERSAGIGNSHNNDAGGTVIFNGGNIIAKAGITAGAAIGTASTSSGSSGTFTIIVNGGNISASSRSSSNFPAIGCGEPFTMAEMTVNGGSIKAFSEGNSPAVGMAEDCTFILDINGGSIYAESKKQSAIGIKTGQSSSRGECNINITDGTLTAFSNNKKNAINEKVGSTKVNLNVNYCCYNVLAGSDSQSAETVETYTGGAYAGFTPREEAMHIIKTVHPMELAVTDEDGNITEYGHKTYYECWCGNYYSDEACAQLIDDLDNWMNTDGRTEYDILDYSWNGEYCTASFSNSKTGETGPVFTTAGIMETVSDETCTEERVCRYKAVFEEPDFWEVTYSDDFEIAGTKGHIDSDADMYCDRCKNPYYLDESGVLTAPFECSVASIKEDTAVLTDGWYILDTDTVLASPLTINGDVRIILANGSTLTAEKGILLTKGNSLTVYAQSADTNMGKIIASGSKGTAGIGGNIENSNAGNLTVNGGYVKAVGGYGAPGIGGGLGGENGTVVRNGGTIEAIDGENYSVPHEHTFAAEYSKNEFAHWYAATCEHTDLTMGMAAHTFGEGKTENGKITYTCTVCGYEKVEDAPTLGDIINKVSGTYAGTMPAVEAAVTMTVSADEISTEMIASDWARKTTVDADGAAEWYTESFEDGQPVYPAEPTGTDKEETIEKYLNTEIVITEEDITVGDNISVPAGSCVFSDILIFYHEENGEIQEIFINGAALKRIHEAQHEHTFATEYSKNEFVHWYAAACEHTDLTKGMAVHTFDEGTTKDGKTVYTCTVCGYEKGEDEVKIALDNTIKALNEAKAALANKEAELKTAEENLKKATDDLADAEDALGKKAAALAEAEENLNKAQNDLAAAENQVKALTDELNKEKLELADAKTALAEKEQQAAKLAADLEKAQSDLANANTDIGKMKAQIEALTGELEKAQKELADTGKALEDKQTEVGTLTKELQAANTELAQTKAALEKVNTELNTAKSEKTTLETQLAAKETELEKLKQSAGAKDEAIKKLESEIAGLEASIQAKDTEINTKAKTISNLEKSVDEFEKTVKAKNDEITEKIGEIAALENRIDELEKAVEAKNGEITAKAEEITALENSIDELKKTVETKNGEIEAKNGEIKALENDVAGLESAVETKNGEIAAKAEEISGLKGNISSLEDEVNGAKSEIAKKNAQIENLNEELEKAKAEIEELKKGEDTSCPYCGKEKHENFFDKVLCFFKRIGYFFKILFDFSMDKKN